MFEPGMVAVVARDPNGNPVQNLTAVLLLSLVREPLSMNPRNAIFNIMLPNGKFHLIRADQLDPIGAHK